VPLESVPAMMRRARDVGCVIGYFESWNLEPLYGVVEAAEEARASGLRVARVASGDVPVPFSPPLENAYRPEVVRIVAAAHGICRSARP
jgi:hypothetical protein